MVNKERKPRKNKLILISQFVKFRLILFNDAYFFFSVLFTGLVSFTWFFTLYYTFHVFTNIMYHESIVWNRGIKKIITTTNKKIKINGKHEEIQLLWNMKKVSCHQVAIKQGETNNDNNNKKINLLVSDGNFLPTAETAVAKTRPKSAITVSVNGIPINANSIQNPRPPVVTGTMLP